MNMKQSTEKSNIELLAPAGSLEKLKYAIEFGADAVYCGLPDFSLRQRNNVFSIDDLKESVDFCHARNKKIYFTLNIFAHNHHLEKISSYLEKIKELNPDGLIISDPGIISIVKETLPDMPLILSTQANCTNYKAAEFWQKQGIKRVILGREVTLAEIKEIHEKLPDLELECFCHGAMCMAYSGRCILSKYFTNRSANLGDCSQPCRYKYNLYVEEETRPKNFLPIEEDLHGSYIFNSKDLCLIKYLDELINAGICSLKIEGRAKSLYYVANTVKCYRKAIDLLPIDSKEKENEILKLEKELAKGENRGFTTGFIFGKDLCEQNTENSHEFCEYEFAGEIEDDKGTVRVHNAIYVGDEIEVIPPIEDNFKITINKIIDCDTMKEVMEAHGGQEKRIILDFGRSVTARSLIRRKIKIKESNAKSQMKSKI